MYANLRVTITADDGSSIVNNAHEVRHEGGQLVVLLDGATGESNYAEPIGVIAVGPTDTVTVTADF